MVAIAILSENQYIAKLKTSAMISAITMPFVPQNEPIRTNSPPSAAIRIQVFRRLIPVPSSCLPPAEDAPATSGEVSSGSISPRGPAPPGAC